MAAKVVGIAAVGFRHPTGHWAVVVVLDDGTLFTVDTKPDATWRQLPAPVAGVLAELDIDYSEPP